MKCQYDKIDTKVKSKDIYKYFIKMKKSRTFSPKSIEPKTDLETIINNIPIYPWISLTLFRIESETKEKPSSNEDTLNLISINNKK